MNKVSRALPLGVWVLAGIFASVVAVAQGTPSPSLEDQLRAQFKLVRLDEANNVAQPGTVLVIQKSGLLGFSPSSAVLLPAKYQDGALHPPNAIAKGVFGGLSSKFTGKSDTSRNLDVGEKVYPWKIEVNVKSDKVSFTIVECDSCNGVQQPSSYKSLVVFQFPKGYLSAADVSQVADVISQVFTVDAGGGEQQAQGSQGQSQPQAANAAPQPPATIALGQTPDEVQAILGPPEKIVNLGAKQIYVYKDLKVTFLSGKVSDVQ